MKYLIILTSLIMASSALAETKNSSSSTSSPPTIAKESSELTVGVKGMVCAFCAQGIEKKFKAQKEVQDIEVSLENSYVKIKFKDGQRLSNEKIAELLKDAGYEATFGG